MIGDVNDLPISVEELMHVTEDSAIVEKFNDFKTSVESYQLQNLDGFDEWNRSREKSVSERY